MKRRLTSKQRKIIAKIKRLYRKREPLNITAVKREHPKLIKAVYDIKPFWGWKRALEDAGIDYLKINVELEEYCKCELCGKEYRHLASHLVRIHGGDKYEYRMDYPGADIFSEELRARISRMKSAVLPHWEPLWTREYVMDRIMEFHRLGIRLNRGWAAKNEPSLASFATKYFDGWDNALRAAGMNVDRIRLVKRRHYTSRRHVVREISRRKRHRLPINRDALERGKHADTQLCHAAKKYCGGWRQAIEAAGISYEKVFIDRRRYPDKGSVLRAIRSRKRRGLPLNSGAVNKGLHRDRTLYRSTYREFGSWPKAIETAGLRYETLCAKVGKYSTPDRLIKEIRRRKRHGLPLNFKSAVCGEHADSSLIHYAVKHFGGWGEAIEAAGIRYKDARSRVIP